MLLIFCSYFLYDMWINLYSSSSLIVHWQQNKKGLYMLEGQCLYINLPVPSLIHVAFIIGYNRHDQLFITMHWTSTLICSHSDVTPFWQSASIDPLIPRVCYERNVNEFYLSIWNHVTVNQRPQLYIKSPQPHILILPEGTKCVFPDKRISKFTR